MRYPGLSPESPSTRIRKKKEVENGLKRNNLLMNNMQSDYISVDRLFVNVLDGVGDIWWTYSKLNALELPIHFLINRGQFKTEHGFIKGSPKRAHQLIEILPGCTYEYVKETYKANWLYKNSISADVKKHTLYGIINSEDTESYTFCTNPWMEKGMHLLNVWPDLPLIYARPPLESYASKERVHNIQKDTIFIHGSTYGNKGSWSDLSYEDIVKLASFINKKYKLKIGITGAVYDNIDWNHLIHVLEDNIGEKVVSLVGEHLATTLLGLERSFGWIGPINGLGIVSLTLGVPVFSFWVPGLQTMIPTITNPYLSNPYRGVISKNDYINDLNNWVEECVGYHNQQVDIKND